MKKKKKQMCNKNEMSMESINYEMQQCMKKELVLCDVELGSIKEDEERKEIELTIAHKILGAKCDDLVEIECFHEETDRNPQDTGIECIDVIEELHAEVELLNEEVAAYKKRTIEKEE